MRPLASISPVPSTETPSGISTASRSRRRGALGSAVTCSAIATRLVRQLTIRCRMPQASIAASRRSGSWRSEEHTSELQSHSDLVCRLLLEKKKKKRKQNYFQKKKKKNKKYSK